MFKLLTPNCFKNILVAVTLASICFSCKSLPVSKSSSASNRVIPLQTRFNNRMEYDEKHLSSCMKVYKMPGIQNPYVILQISEKGFVIGGETFSTNGDNSKSLIIKLDSEGNILWKRRFGSKHTDDNRHSHAAAILITDDEEIIVVGNEVISSDLTGDNVGYSAYIRKIGKSGEIIWSKYNNYESYFLYFTAVKKVGSGFIVYGDARCCELGECLLPVNYGTMLTMSDNGAVIKTTKTNKGYSGEQYSIDRVSGSVGNGSVSWVSKWSATGKIAWSFSFKYENRIEHASITKTSDGGFILSGRSINDNKYGAESILLMKVSKSGRIEWRRNIHGRPDVDGKIITINDIGGGYMLFWSGNTDRGGYPTIMVDMLDTNGNVIWSKAYGGKNTVVLDSVNYIPDQGYVVVGRMNSRSEDPDIFLLKLTPAGNCEELH